MFHLNNLLGLFVLYTCCAREPPTVNIPNQGTIIGKEISMIRTYRIIAYLGIPYAQPPVGMLRFAPPKTDPPPSWEGIRNATEYAPACLQVVENYQKQETQFLSLISNLQFDVDEDCLYLNVFVPYGGAPRGGFATIVWIHPGNFTSGSPHMWNPYTLVNKQGVIVVTIAYRLNIMGFFSSMDGEAPGNFGLMDQQAALVWVKNNINIFNGDPNNICLMGYGAGSTSIGLHMTKPESRELFAKAIAMSGNFLSPSVVRYTKEDEELLSGLAEFHGCVRKPSSLLIWCLRQKTGNELVQETAHFKWRPSIDVGLTNTTSPFLPELPRNYFERGEFHKVPFLTGYTNMEEALNIPDSVPENATDDFFYSMVSDIVNADIPATNDTDVCPLNFNLIVDSVMFFYGSALPIKDSEKNRRLIIDMSTEKSYGSSTFLQASYVSKFESNTYMYRFDMEPSTLAAKAGIPEWASVPHLYDLIYVWGMPYWAELPEQQEWDDRDKRTADIIMSFWTNFAKFSNPTASILYPIRWDQFNKDNPGILIIDRSFNMSDATSVNYKAFQFWNEYYPKIFEIGTQCCNVTDLSNSLHHFTSNLNLLVFVNVILSYFILL